ncbi:MAG: helix-turn-helix domain-containing protein [Desulfopila sp.]
MSQTNPELELADAFVCDTGCNVFLTGKAGTGKTTFLHNVKKRCEKRMVVTAPTGVAAINAGGVTLHSFFQMPFGPFIPGSEHTRQHKFSRDKINILKSLDLLVIDEISMVRADLLDGVDAVLRRYRRSDLAFGGVQLLLIGDLHQLAPVVKGEDWRLLAPYYDSPYFFSSTALAKTELVSVELKHIYRQTDSEFIALLNRVRDNNLDQAALKKLNERCIEDLSSLGDTGYITLCSHNASADRINSQRLALLKTPVHHFTAQVEGEFPEHAYPTPATLTLKVGAQVMFMRNDSSSEKRYFNGKIGTITKITTDGIHILCRGERHEIIIAPATWENIDYSLDSETMEVRENRVGAYSQYPLKLAWAITIHKSQGLTFENAIIDAQASFSHGQVYVALSRCKTLEGMILSSPITPGSVKTDPIVLSFSQKVGRDLPSKKQLVRAKNRYQQDLLLGCFDFRRLQNLTSRFISLVEDNRGVFTVSGVQDLAAVRQEIFTTIVVVGDNFRAQLQSLFRDDKLPAEDPVIRERLDKAATYFLEKFRVNLEERLLPIALETDNKELRKKSRNALKYLAEEVAIKVAGVRICGAGFDSAEYLRAISKAAVAASSKTKAATPPAITYSETDVDHPELFQQLRDWRNEKARSENLSPFQVMHQKTLVQIAVRLPDSLLLLKETKGIGEKLAARYGEEIIAMVSRYRTEHNIDEVQLPVVQSPPSTQEQNKPKDTRKLSFDMFTQGMTVEEIARERGLVLATIEGHLAHFVALGEMDIDRLVTKEKLTTMIEVIRTLKTKSLRDIKSALGEEYGYGEIKQVLAHLKRSSQ